MTFAETMIRLLQKIVYSLDMKNIRNDGVCPNCEREIPVFKSSMGHTYKCSVCGYKIHDWTITGYDGGKWNVGIYAINDTE